jgi:ubiquinone/menaquinone biosynthesis C-methylase UbiE
MGIDELAAAATDGGGASAPTALAARVQRRVWSRRVDSWDRHQSAGLEKVVAAVVAEAGEATGLSVVDLGCGTGQLCLPLAEKGAGVLAVDVSEAMLERLRERAAERQAAQEGRFAGSISWLCSPIETLAVPAQTVDLVVSSYALHHLRDPEKARLVRNAYGWLRPGGRLIVADMMLGRGATADDRRIIRSKVAALARRGPGGWWRIAKNAARYLLRVQERPISSDAWSRLLRDAGFADVTARPIVAEAALVQGRRPRG